MEFTNEISKLINNGITCIRSDEIQNEKKEQLKVIIDSIGVASSKAQNIRIPITSMARFKDSSHRLYILKQNQSFVGFIKVGIKNLYLTDGRGKQVKCEPLCVLDFYVHESMQRAGHGHSLFANMLSAENVLAHQLAIDRPSEKFIGFLRKHYNLTHPLHQMNRFVIFKEFFKKSNEKCVSADLSKLRNVSVRPQPPQSLTFGKKNNTSSAFSRHSPNYVSPTDSTKNLQNKIDCQTSSKSPNNFVTHDFNKERRADSSKMTSLDSPNAEKYHCYQNVLDRRRQENSSSSWNIFGVPSMYSC